MDFAKYKGYLKQYLQRKGYDTSAEFVLSFCHEEKTPSLKIYDEDFHCFGCGKHGDVYDAVEILEGINDKKEQYLFLENLFAQNYIPSLVSDAGKEKETFTADPAAQKQLENYLSKNSAAEKEIIKFLNLRAAFSSFGTIPAYPADLIPAMVKEFLYWPGLDLVRRDLGAGLLKRAGIPLKNPNTGIAWWEHSGVIMKLGKGYKLHYYIEGECKKFGSRGSSTFPMPGSIDKTSPVIVVEGEMDAIASNAIGLKNLFASGGTSGLTGPKIKNYLLEVPEIILCFDADDPGRKASGLIPYEYNDTKRTNIPEIMRHAGYKGIIKTAELPVSKTKCDPDALIIAGKRDIVIKAIQEAREYVPPGKKADEKTPLKWEPLSTGRIEAVLKKIKKSLIEEKNPEDVQLFVTAIIKAAKFPKNIEKPLLEWGATKEQIKNKNDTTPYVLLEFAWKYGLSTYLQRTLKTELTPASELLKRINRHKPIVDIDFEEIKTNKNVIQFLETYGVRSAALMVADILDGRIIYVESEKKYYFFNGHTWQREPDMTGAIYNIMIAVMIYFYEKTDLKELGLRKSDIDEIIKKMESRRFRVEIMQEFSQLELLDIFKTTVLFDGPAVRETLTLIDSVIDFSGKEIIYRKSERDEFRREILPYTSDQIKSSIKPKKYINFVHGNFKHEKTLESFLLYLSLILSRNTKYKYGGIFIGETNTGKTANMDIMQAVFPNMIKTIPAEVLVSKGLRQVSGNEATPYIAGLEGKGCGLASETGRNMYLNNALWKLLTGGDTLTARDLYQSPHEFTPTSQIIILTNYLPHFDSHDNATIGRMIIIPFLIEHKRGSKESVDMDEFKEKLKPEYPGIVKMFIEYYIKLKNEYRGAIPLSDECQKYKKLYLDELDTDLDCFVKDRLHLTVENNPFIQCDILYEEYLKYFNLTSENSGKDVLPRNKFTRFLKKDYKQITQKQKKINGKPVLCFFNVKLKDIEDTEPPAATKSTPPPDDPFN